MGELDKDEAAGPANSRRQVRKLAKANVTAEREAAAELQKEIAALPPEEQKAARAELREELAQSRHERKDAFRALPRSERRKARRLYKAENKYRHRRRRIFGWSVLALILVLVGALVAPFISDYRTLTSISVDSDSPAGQRAREEGEEISYAIAAEGIVLLENEGALPLATTRVNVFGFDSFNMRFGGGGSGAADQSRAVGFYEGLQGAGIEYNEELHALHEKQGAAKGKQASSGLGQVVGMLLGKSAPKDPHPDYLTEEVMAAAKAYSPVALVVFGNDGVEAKDFAEEELRLTENQRELLGRVTEDFSEVVVIINSGNTMELGFLQEYPQIKAALSVATAGPAASTALAEILTGEVNPSGHITDTYAYEVGSAPAAENFGDYRYDNFDRAFLNYAEGIYVGYRFYETYYQGNEAAYQQTVQYPFGYGLSYTTFAWEAGDLEVAEGKLSVAVEVTNTGEVAGKDVVQVYYRPPYTPGGIEKSAVALAGYEKTAELAPGESETVTITFPQRAMASWDTEGGGFWTLDPGEYQIDVATDVHSPVASYTHTVEKKVVYDADEVTGVPLSNQFASAAGDVTYLSRNDWEGTYPNPDEIDYTASPVTVAAMEASPLPTEDLPFPPKLAEERNLTLQDMRGVEYDSKKWDSFLNQFTLDELKLLFSRGGYQTVAIERLGIPESVFLDGPAGISFFFGNVEAASYPTAVVVGSTWNDALAYQFGEAVGREARALGVTGWYAPGMNLHRTAMGGRNFEYYSEDPLLSGRMGANVVAGAESLGVVTTMKHFLLNDQETNARGGINIWANEQSLRELYLKPFEITVKEGSPTGAMSSFVHLGTSWCGADEALLDTVLREEWGFTGLVTTDAVLGDFMSFPAAALHGSDLMLDPFPSRNENKLDEAYQKVPNALTWGLRSHAHNICYALANSDLTR